MTDEPFKRDPALNIYQRINAVMAEVDYVQKEKKKSGMQYSYVSHDAVTAAVRPYLVKYGIVYHVQALRYKQDGNRTQIKMWVVFANIDNPDDDYIMVESLGYGVDGQDKGPGKAMSYAMKYALLKTLGLETGDDPEAVQDERANHVSTRLGPTDIPREEGDPSAAKSKGPFGIFDDEMMAQKSYAGINRWWESNAAAIKDSMNAQFQWDFFEKTILRGLELCSKKLEVELFWSFHENKFAKLKTLDIVRYETLEERMLNKVDQLNKLAKG